MLRSGLVESQVKVVYEFCDFVKSKLLVNLHIHRRMKNIRLPRLL